jgi:hypothetical protein
MNGLTYFDLHSRGLHELDDLDGQGPGAKVSKKDFTDPHFGQVFERQRSLERFSSLSGHVQIWRWRFIGKYQVI